tara:strand:+ start:298 stop:510 length:213 start_codon:yes stop_codon:yes gene_type:complete
MKKPRFSKITKMSNPKAFLFIKTECGRAKFGDLAKKTGLFAKIRLFWFIFFAAIKDWNLLNPDQIEESKS